MAVTISFPLHDAAWTAKNNASDGNKTNAFGNAIITGIGVPYRRVLRRDGVVVWAATVSTAIQLAGGNLVLPATGIVQDLMSAAVHTSGTWTHSIENYNDSTWNIVTDVSSTGGTDIMQLSASLTNNGTLQVSQLTIALPVFDTVGTASYPTSSDPRTYLYFDASLPLASQPAAVSGGYGGQAWPQFNNSWFVGAYENPPTSGNRMSQVPEPGGYVNNGITQFIRTTDPADGTKKAFKHRIHPSIDLFAGDTVRSAYLAPDYVPYSTDMWVAFAIRFEGWPSKTVTFFDVHDNSELPSPVRRDAYGNYIPSPHRQSPVQCWIESNGKFTWGVNGCYKPDYVKEDTVISLQPQSAVVSANASTASVWNYFAVNFKAARSMSEGPFAKIYRAEGSGAVSLIHDISGVPVGYYDTPIDKLFPKLGIYQWGVTQGSSSGNPCSDYSIHTKGLFVFFARSGTPTITASGLISMLRSK